SPRLQGDSDGSGADARFVSPEGLAIASDGNLYVADNGSHTIRKVEIATAFVTTFAGMPGMAGSTDGVGEAARFSGPRGLTADRSDNLYVADAGNSTVRAISITTGAVTTLAGSAGQTGSQEGVGTAARVRNPTDVGWDQIRNHLWVADSANYTLREIDLATSTVTTPVGAAGQKGFVDGRPTDARLADAEDIAVFVEFLASGPYT